MRIELTPPVEVQQVDEDAEILIVAGCALGFVGAGHPPHVLSLVDGCELMVAGVAVDDLLVAINNEDPRDLERMQVVKALQAATSLEFRRPKPVLVPASAAKNSLEEESGDDGASDISAPNAPVVEISDEEKLEDVQEQRPKKVLLVPRVKLKKAAQPRVTLTSRSPLEPERALGQLQEAEFGDSNERAVPVEMAQPRKAGALRPLAVLKAALRRQPRLDAEDADRWRARRGGRPSEANETGDPIELPPGQWTASPHPNSRAWQSQSPPHGYTHAPPPPQYARAPSQHAPPPHWEAQWGLTFDQYRQPPAASSASAATAKGSGKGYRVEQRSGPRLAPDAFGGASLVVDHLDPAVHTHELLTSYFRSFGNVKDIKLNSRRDEAVVYFRAVESAEAALTKPVLNTPSIGLRPWIPTRRGQRSPFEVASYMGYTAAVEAKTKAAVSDEGELRDTASDALDGSTASASPSTGSPPGGRTATRAAAVSSTALPAAAQDGNMQLESGQALEKKRLRDDLEHQKKELLQKYTDQLKIVMAKVNDPQTLEDHKEKLQTMLASLQAKILAMQPEPKKRRETPPSPAYPPGQDTEVPAGTMDLELPQPVLAEAEQDGEVEPMKADKAFVDLEPVGE